MDDQTTSTSVSRRVVPRDFARQPPQPDLSGRCGPRGLAGRSRLGLRLPSLRRALLCIMSNHFHLMIETVEPNFFDPGRNKKISANYQTGEAEEAEGQVWQPNTNSAVRPRECDARRFRQGPDLKNIHELASKLAATGSSLADRRPSAVLKTAVT